MVGLWSYLQWPKGYSTATLALLSCLLGHLGAVLLRYFQHPLAIKLLNGTVLLNGKPVLRKNPLEVQLGKNRLK